MDSNPARCRAFLSFCHLSNLPFMEVKLYGFFLFKKWMPSCAALRLVGLGFAYGQHIAGFTAQKTQRPLFTRLKKDFLALMHPKSRIRPSRIWPQSLGSSVAMGPLKFSSRPHSYPDQLSWYWVTFVELLVVRTKSCDVCGGGGGVE